MKTGQTKVAKFGVFCTTEKGADYLMSARNNGKPMIKREHAVDFVNDNKQDFTRELFIRAL